MMKTIDKMTEAEILALNEQDVQQLIKFRKAEEGVKLIERPEAPELFNIPEKDKVVYKCPMFGQYLTFENVGELENILQLIRESNSVCSISTDYSHEKSTAHILAKLKTQGYGSEEWDEITTMKVFSTKLYNEVHTSLKRNENVEAEYKKAVSEYDGLQKESQYIEDDIWARVQEVRDKYYKLNLNIERFKVDYLPLAEGDETVAMNFLKKAYDLTEEEEAYVLSNYNIETE